MYGLIYIIEILPSLPITIISSYWKQSISLIAKLFYTNKYHKPIWLIYIFKSLYPTIKLPISVFSNPNTLIHVLTSPVSIHMLFSQTAECPHWCNSHMISYFLLTYIVCMVSTYHQVVSARNCLKIYTTWSSNKKSAQ